MTVSVPVDIQDTQTMVCDIMDACGDSAQLLNLVFYRYGPILRTYGPVRTARCFEENVHIQNLLGTPGQALFWSSMEAGA